MTQRDALHDATPDDPPDDQARLKTTLFCPDCDHRSPVDGDWVLRTAADGYEYECPDCGAAVVRQRDYDADCDAVAANTAAD